MNTAINLESPRARVITELRAAGKGSQARAASVPLKDHTAQLKREPDKRYALVTRGSASVRIYGRADGSAGPYTIAWRQSSFGKRQRAMRSTLKSAITLAEEKATALANGETWRLSMTQKDWASYQRSLELLAPTGLALELACSILAECCQLLPKGVSPLEACRAYVERQRAGVTSRNIPQLVQDLLASRQSVGSRGQPISEAWEKKLRQQLERFAAHFTGPLETLTGNEIESWLNGLKGVNNKRKATSVAVGAHTRANYRAAILSLVRFAKFKRHLSRDWSELDDVQAAKPHDAEVKILTPEQLTKLLARAPASLVPFLAITAFAGVRHEEMVSATKKILLDWRDIDLDAGTIYIRKGVAKTGRDRLVPIPANLSAWLGRYRQPNGPVCELSNTGSAINRAKKKAGIPAGKNETRNTLRKSFISYRLAQVKNAGQVAEEAGTSVAKIRSNYKRPAPESEAKRWFDIWPTSADIVQLPLKLG